MKLWQKSLFVIIISIVLFIVLVLTTIGIYFYYIAIKRNDKSFLQKSLGFEEIDTVDEVPSGQIQEELEAGAIWVDERDHAIWRIKSRDGLTLASYYIPAKKPTKKTVILTHGYTSNGKDMGLYAKFFSEKLGFHVLLPDARGHGKSEGNYIGFGWHEREDILLWIQKIIERDGETAQIVLMGVSMGGATVMMVSGEDLPSQVKAIIEDCGYTSVYDELSYQLKQLYHLPSFPILPVTSIITDIRAGYNFYEASALEQVKKNNRPILFIHGEKDTFVPTKMVYELYNNAKGEKDIYIVPGAGHGKAYTVNPKAYETKIIDFLDPYIK